MSPLLTICSLSAGYTANDSIVKDFSMQLQEGEMAGIIGFNGVGKSTICKAIMNMVPYRQGRVDFGGEEVTALTTHELVRRGMSIMMQGGRVFPSLSVLENIEMAARGSKEIDFGPLKESIPLLSMEKKAMRHTIANTLSGGQLHQLSLVMTLLTHPRLVILDEPTAGLDNEAKGQFYQILEQLRSNLALAVILVEHDQLTMLDKCTKIYSLNEID